MFYTFHQMENQTQIGSNYHTLKNDSYECKCPQSMKCTVNVEKISGLLDSYYAKFQNLSKEKNKHKVPHNDLPQVFSGEATTNHSERATNLWSTFNTKTVPNFGYQEVNGNEIGIQQTFSNAEANNSTKRISCTLDNSINVEHSKPSRRPLAAETAARPFRCDECGMAFKRNLHLKRHFTVTHTSKKNFSCSVCGKSFSRKDYLDKHLATHEKKRFKLKLLQQGIVVRTKMNVKSTK